MAPILTEVPVTRLSGVGPRLRDKLAHLGIRTVADILFHLPFRYQDRTRVTPIAAMRPDEDCVIEGEVRLCDISFGRRRALVCRLADGSGITTLRFFHFNAAQKAALQPGTRLRCFGTPRRGPSGLELFHPEYRHLNAETPPVPETLTPVYPSTEGIHQATWRKLAAGALALLNEHSLPDLLPARGTTGAVGLAESLRYLHQPPVDADLAALAAGVHPCQRRLACEELVSHHLSLLRLRQRTRSQHAPAIPANDAAAIRLLAAAGLQPTAAQHRVAAEIAADLASEVPMLRLVQGDVGSGKTLVAAMAAVQVIGAGLQVAVMAPTEILAEQHLASFRNWLEPLGYQVVALTGKLAVAERRKRLAAISDGSVALVVGTHALIQDGVTFHRLGLVIIDEQHRFGVHQRLQLREKGRDGVAGYPHQLIMTATPIPRTLAMTAYADLDCSVIDQLPPGRKPVYTVLVGSARRSEVVQRIHAACRSGEQAYWICTLVEASDVLQAQAAEETCAELRAALPDLAIGLVHGRLKPAEKAAVMAWFKQGDIQLLVATTVIEVGVDVPNASLMVIENPERLGLAQLHQLRGRVGRGTRQSHCVLLYQAPLSDAGKQRLTAMRDSQDGFYIAQRDLEIRGPGELLGTRQTGDMQFRIADLLRDADLLDEVRTIAAEIGSPADVEALVRRWLPLGLHYAQA